MAHEKMAHEKWHREKCSRIYFNILREVLTQVLTFGWNDAKFKFKF